MRHSEKIIVIAQAIKVHYWKELYLTLNKEDIPFEMVFVGHIKPNFALPLNFTWVECSLPPAQCAEIAYRYSYKHFPDAKYIVNIADDLLLPPNFLRDNKIFYNRQKEKLGVEILLTGPVCLVQSGFENLMAWKNGGPSLLVTNFTEVSTSIKIGGIDSRFEGIYWDCDRMLRAHAMGGKVVVAPPTKLPSVREREHLPGLYRKYKNIDKVFLDKLWNITTDEVDGKIINCCALNSQNKNENFQKKILIKRKEEVKEYTTVEIQEYYE